MNQKYVIAVVGPTASGKTKLAIDIATQFKTSVVSFDSRQCFKELHIGVAAPAIEEMGDVPHFFIKSHSVHQVVTAAVFEQYALGVLDDLFRSNNMVVAVGGTGLYLQTLLAGLDAIPTIPLEIREQLTVDLHSKGLHYLQQQLQQLDPIYFKQMDTQNTQRVLRALEVCLATSKPYSEFRKGGTATRNFTPLIVGIQPPRMQLYQQINARVLQMVKNGLVQEVEQLLPLKHLNALQTVGYSELFAYLQGETSLPFAIEKIQQHTRNYAKRQLTWFNRNASIHWMETPNVERALAWANAHLE